MSDYVLTEADFQCPCGQLWHVVARGTKSSMGKIKLEAFAQYTSKVE
jgi:ubiquinone biosynthesis protein Coq4